MEFLKIWKMENNVLPCWWLKILIATYILKCFAIGTGRKRCSNVYAKLHIFLIYRFPLKSNVHFISTYKLHKMFLISKNIRQSIRAQVPHCSWFLDEFMYGNPKSLLSTSIATFGQCCGLGTDCSDDHLDHPHFLVFA